MNDLISIVIPVYNVEDYLPRCLDSIVKQTYRNIEIILIDDGSKDKSGSICDKYAKMDNRIKVFHNKNNGVAYTRNFGIEVSNGKYLTFVDSDDYVDENYVEFLYVLLKKNNCTISVCSNVKIKNNTKHRKPKINIKNNIYDGHEALLLMLYQKELDSSLWGKMYQTNLLKSEKVSNYKVFEDIDYLIKVMPKSNKVIVSNNQLYYYYVRQNSLIHSDVIKNINIIKDILLSSKEKNTDERIIKALDSRILDVYFNQMCNCKIFSKEYYEAKNYIQNERKKIIKDSNINRRSKIAIYISYISFILLRIIYRFKH